MQLEGPLASGMIYKETRLQVEGPLVSGIKKVQDVAIKIMNDDPNLTKEKNLELKKQIENKFKDRIEI